jgi:biopolymer transport protein ExbB
MNIIDSFLGFTLLGAEWVMWVLVVLSLVSITIMVERTIYFWGQRPDVSAIIMQVRKSIASKDLPGAQKQLDAAKGVAATVAGAAFEEAAHGPAAFEEAASGVLILERLRLERNLAFLGTVGNNAPFIGLFGTVIGVIQAFDALSLNTQGGASTVMAGISEALVATAIGLLVAIPAVIAFNIFQRRIKTLIGDTNALIHAILATLRNEQN